MKKTTTKKNILLVFMQKTKKPFNNILSRPQGKTTELY